MLRTAQFWLIKQFFFVLFFLARKSGCPDYPVAEISAVNCISTSETFLFQLKTSRVSNPKSVSLIKAPVN